MSTSPSRGTTFSDPGVRPAIPPAQARREAGICTPQQERFCQEYLKDRNIAQAYIRAGYKGNIKVKPYELFQRVPVQARIAQLLAEDKRKNEVSIERIRADLMRLASEAEDQGKLAVAIRALELLGKHVGMFIEKSESEIRVIGNDESEIDARIERILQNAATAPKREDGDAPSSDA